MGEIRNVHISAGNLKERNPLDDWSTDDIKMDLTEIGWESMA
jgi:hypothetical protein